MAGIKHISHGTIMELMRQRQLEMLLQSIPPHPSPSPGLEQYHTPAPIAAAVLYDALAAGFVRGRCVLDLGCGTGIFTLGAAILGAGCALGVDLDGASVKIAYHTFGDLYEKRPGALGSAPVEFIESTLEDFRPGDHIAGFDRENATVIMNPPFGAQRRHADRLFLDRGSEFASAVFSMHLAGTEGFVKRYMEEKGMDVFYRRRFDFEIPHMFDFHSKEKDFMEVVALGFTDAGGNAIGV